MKSIAIESPYYAAFRNLVRRCIRANIPPPEAPFGRRGQQSLFSLPESSADRTLNVPQSLVKISRTVSCHRDPEVLRTLYGVLWRLQNGEKQLLQDPADADTRALKLAERSVLRDIHKMTAFVRFRRAVAQGVEHFVAWHRPDHYIVHLTAPFFVERFGAMRWSILTPDDSVTWNLEELQFGPGVPQSEAPSGDELEQLWLTYYSAIFNPARLKVAAMKKELPVRHWPTLPESRLIPTLIRQAPAHIPANQEADRGIPDMPGLDSLPILQARAAECHRCELYAHATQVICGEGPHNASLMLVGEQPGDVEDTTGRPFVGPAGQVLDQALAAAAIDRQSIYLTNSVKHFYHERRGKLRLHKKPTGTHIAACQVWLDAELQIVKPKVIVALGATAALALLGRAVTITRERGRPIRHHLAGQLVITNHPSYILRLPVEVRDAEFRRMVDDLSVARTLA